MRDDVEGTWPENKDEDSRWKMAKRRARRSQKAKWRTSRMTTMAKNLEDEIEASPYLMVSVLRPALSGVGQVQVDVAAVADKNGFLARGEGAGMAGFLQQRLVLRGTKG